MKGAIHGEETGNATRSAEAANENQRRVEGVFDELAVAKPDNVSYIVLRLADDSFLHVSFHDHGDDELNPIASTAAFAHFQEDQADRREGGVDQQTATGRRLHHDYRLSRRRPRPAHRPGASALRR
jgi:hypothetical protein